MKLVLALAATIVATGALAQTTMTREPGAPGQSTTPQSTPQTTPSTTAPGTSTTTAAGFNLRISWMVSVTSSSVPAGLSASSHSLPPRLICRASSIPCCAVRAMAGIAPALALQLLEHILDLRATVGTTFLIIEHDMEAIMAISDHVIVMDEGRVIARGLPEEIQNDERVIDAYLGHRTTPMSQLIESPR